MTLVMGGCQDLYPISMLRLPVAGENPRIPTVTLFLPETQRCS